MEDLPYLEILCVSDTQGDALESLAAGGGTCNDDEGSVTESHQSYDKQKCLIPVAWSKPAEDEAETANGETEQNHDNSTKSQIQSTREKTVQETDKDVNPTLLQSGSPDHQFTTEQVSPQRTRHDAPSLSFIGCISLLFQLNLDEKPKVDRLIDGEVASENIQQTDATDENLQRLQPNVLDNTDDLCSGTSDHSAARELTEEMCPSESSLGNLREPEDSGHEDLTWSQESTVRQFFVHFLISRSH